ncbi:hypothetical protein GQ457_15G028880 [Hibiscus cannabinus]
MWELKDHIIHCHNESDQRNSKTLGVGATNACCGDCDIHSIRVLAHSIAVENSSKDEELSLDAEVKSDTYERFPQSLRSEDWQNPDDLDALFEWFFKFRDNKEDEEAWFISVAAYLWSLWIARNDKIFEGKTSNFLDLLYQAKLKALTWLKANMCCDMLSETCWFVRPSASFHPTSLSKAIGTHTGQIFFQICGLRRSERYGCGGFLPTKEVVSEQLAVKIALDIFSRFNGMGDLELVIEINSQVVLNWLESHTLRLGKLWEIFEDYEQGRCYNGHNACFAWSRAIESFGGMVVVLVLFFLLPYCTWVFGF